MRMLRRTRGHGAGTRSDSRSWSSRPNPRPGSRRRRYRMTAMRTERRDGPLVAPGCVVALILLNCLLATTARGEIVPPRGAVDSRIRTAAYDGDQVYRLRGFVG